MSLLLDTGVVLWWLADDPGLPEEIKDRLDHEPDVRVSAATIWEIAIKQALGKISAPADLPEPSPRQRIPGASDRFHPRDRRRAPSADSPRPVRPDAGRAGPLRGSHPRDQGSVLPAIRGRHSTSLNCSRLSSARKPWAGSSTPAAGLCSSLKEAPLWFGKFFSNSERTVMTGFGQHCALAHGHLASGRRIVTSALRRGWRLRRRGEVAGGCASSRRRRGRPPAARRRLRSAR